MEAATLKALQGSIAKWEAIVAGTGEDDGAVNCPLCHLFGDTCQGCPVMQKTGQFNCGGSPYYKYAGAIHAYGTHSSEAIAAAQSELDFLRGLLPKEDAAEVCHPLPWLTIEQHP